MNPITYMQSMKCYICDDYGPLEVYFTMVSVPEEKYTIRDGRLVKFSKQRWAHKDCYDKQ